MRMFEAVSAHEVTSMHCGGTIARIYEPEDLDQLARFIREHHDFHILGGGTNTIFTDSETTRPVIRLGAEFASLEPIPGGLLSGAAVPMKHLVSHCVKNGLAGIEFMAGIPGCLGGAICMNAGTPEKGILDAVTQIEAVGPQGLRTLNPYELDYGYRRGNIPGRTVITSARISLVQSTPKRVREAVMPYIIRKKAQPRGFNSGSMFKNPVGMSAGMLIEMTGLKGTRIGGARISEIHANFIINDGTATTRDIKELMELAKKRVKRRFGLVLTQEVRFVDQ